MVWRLIKGSPAELGGLLPGNNCFADRSSEKLHLLPLPMRKNVETLSPFSFLPGDIITHINGLPVQSVKEFYKFLEGDDPLLEMRVIRRDRMLNIQVQPE